MKRFALIPAAGLGDGLLSLPLAKNLMQQGWQVDIYSNVLKGLADWFPDFQFFKLPTADAITACAAAYDNAFICDHMVPDAAFSANKNNVILDRKALNRRISYTQNLANICCGPLGCEWKTIANGIMPLADYQYRKHKHRVCIHPTSAYPASKDWQPKKFLCLATRLKQQGFQPVFLLSPKEAVVWTPIINQQFDCLMEPDLSKVAGFIYESGFLIGNDSGPRHLAANLNVPSLTVYKGHKNAVMWDPIWGEYNQKVSAALRLPGPHGRKFWQCLLSVRRVNKAFLNLVKRVDSPQ